MLDIETIGNQPDSAIIQIAAVYFDPNTGDTGSEFNGLVKSGPGRIERGTVLWWMQQPGGADLAAKIDKQGGDLGPIREEFGRFMRVCGCPEVPVYAHGAPFDFPILRNAYASVGQKAPWGYRDELCTRSYYRELGQLPEVSLPAGYVKHDAVSDCKLQIAQLVEARRRLGLVRAA
jgi:3'-5' exoribonuclease-like protein